MRQTILLDKLPHFNGTMDDYRFEVFQAQVLSPLEFILVNLDHPITFLLGLLGGLGAICLLIWTSEEAYKVTMRYLLGGMLVPLLAYSGDYTIRAITGATYSKSLNILLGAITVSWWIISYNMKLGRAVETRGLGYTAALILGIVPLVISYQRVLLPRVFVATDTTKLLFAVFLNPLIMEVPIGIMRCTARLISNNEPFTNAFLVGLVIAFKKAFGRFALVTVENTAILTLASVLLTTVEVTLTASVKHRDVWIYRWILGPEKVKRCAVFAKINSHLRVHTALIESCSEYMFILLSAMIVLVLDISPVGTGDNHLKVSPKVGDVILNTIVQIGFEIITDILNVLVLLRAGLPYMVHVASLSRYTLTKLMCCLGAFGAVFLLHLGLPTTIQRLPGTHPASLIFVE